MPTKKELFTLLCIIFLKSNVLFGQFLVAGSSTYSTGNTISLSTTGGSYVVGNYVCNLTIDTLKIGRDSCPNGTPTPLNFYVLKMNANGEVLWLKSSSLTNTNSKYSIFGTFTDSYDNLWIAGNFTDSMCIENQGIKSIGSNDVFVARYKSNGTLDTLIGNFAYDVSSSIYLAGFTSDMAGNALLYGAFKGAMKSSFDTLTHVNSQLFLARVNATMQSEFLITKLDTPIISCDTSAIKLLTASGTALKMAISAYNAKEYRIDTSYVSNSPFPGTTMHIDTNLVSISENTFLAEYNALANFTYNYRTNYQQLSSITIDASGSYYLLDNIEVGGDKNIQIDKYNSTDNLQWTHQTQNSSSSITLIGNTLTTDFNGNVYYGGYFQASSTNRLFSIGGHQLTANKDKNAMAVKLDADGNTIWVQSLGSTSTEDDFDLHHDAINQLLPLSESSILATGYFGTELIISGLKMQNTEGINNLFAGNLDPYPDFIAEFTPTGALEICFGDSVLLQASTASEYTYQWTKNGSDISGANASSYYAKDSAIYGLLIYNTDLNYTKKALSDTIIVNPVPLAEIETTDDTVFCQGETALLHITNIAGYTYHWYNNNSAIGGANQNRYTATRSGIYHLVVTSDKSCSNTSNTINIEVLTPTAQITNTGDLNICDGDSIKLLAYTENDYQYQWYFEGDTLINDTLTYVYAKISGAYQVQTTILGSCQSLSVDANISVTPSPPAEISFSGDSVICFGEQTALAANTGFNLTYFWMLNNDTIPGENNSWIATETEGAYTAIVGFEGSCSRRSNTKTLVVNTLPEVILQLDGDTNICEGQETKLSTHFQTNYAYQWYRNNIEVTNATSNYIRAKKTGTYFARVTNEFGCNKDTPYQSMVVKSAPDASLFFTGDTSFCEKKSVELFTYNIANQSYQWFKNGVVLTNQNNASLVVGETGNYHVQVTNIENLCKAESRIIQTQKIPAPQEIIAVSKDLPICEGDSVILSVTENNDWAYQWFLNGYSLYQDTLATLVAFEQGLYSIQVVNSFLCSDTTPDVLVSLLENPIPGVIVNGLFLATNDKGSLIWSRDGVQIEEATNHLFLVEESGEYAVTAYYPNGCFATSVPIDICNPIPEISVNESYLTAKNGLAYQWFFEDEIIEGATEQVHRAQVSGNYTVAVTCEGNYISVSDPVLICIPVPKITQTASNVLESTQGNSYQWYKDGQQMDGEDARVLVLKNSGEYSVWVTDMEGCSSFAKPFPVSYSDVNSSEYTEQVTLYPNPVEAALNIEVSALFYMQQIQIKILDITGTERFNSCVQLNELKLSVPVRHLNSGIYFLLIESNKAFFTKKFVKN